ncbi:MAG: hypothetical protein ABS75_27650 [Pelagibacterium sp. SCN 63-23]|nr:MAG: hypothetical protein ABS75_27650 [Pelagibacterium sp. SCN 63-23]
MRNIKKLNTIIKRYGASPETKGVPEDAAGGGGMGQHLESVKEKAVRKRRLHAEAEGRVKRSQAELHAAIGLVLDNAAELNALDPVDVLGLADFLKDMLGQDGVRSDIRARGMGLYSTQFARAVALTIVGVPARPKFGRALSEAGFAQIGNMWSGNASIPQAIRLAQTHGLTLLRYDEDDSPIYYLRKGVPQPELAMLEAEHEKMVDAVVRPAAPDLDEVSELDIQEQEAANDGGGITAQQDAEKSHDQPAEQVGSQGSGDSRVSGKSGFGRVGSAKAARPSMDAKAIE